jgi:hypothetical protein
MNKSKLSLSLLVAATTWAASTAFAQSEQTPPPAAPATTAPAAPEPGQPTKWIVDDPTPRERPQRIDVLAGGSPFGSTPYSSVAGMFVIPIVPEGFIPNVNDTFNLEFGAYLDYHSYSNLGIDYRWLQLAPVGGARWDVHLTDKWTVFAMAKFGTSIPLNKNEDAKDVSLFVVDTGIGALWHISNMGSLRLQSSVHAPLAVGWSFPL